jgi:hypothetical protein
VVVIGLGVCGCWVREVREVGVTRGWRAVVVVRAVCGRWEVVIGVGVPVHLVTVVLGLTFKLPQLAYLVVLTFEPCLLVLSSPCLSSTPLPSASRPP